MIKKLFLILAFITFNFNTVFADEITPLTPFESKEILIQTYEFAGDVLNYEELVPNEVNHKGNVYRIADIKAQENTKTETIQKTEPIEKIVTDTEKSNVINLFEKELTIDKDNLKGILKLDENSLKITKNQVENLTNYKTEKYTIYEDKSYYGLESNDYALLPQTLNKDGKTLKLISAEFIKTNSNDIYNANCKYGATFTKKIPNTKEIVKDYKATVNYVGTVEKTVVESRNVTVFYEKDDTISNNINDNNIKNENRLMDNQIFILFATVLIMLFVITLIIISILTRQIKAERRKNFEKNNYKSKKHKHKNKKNEK